jgi:hypothetical protein
MTNGLPVRRPSLGWSLLTPAGPQVDGSPHMAESLIIMPYHGMHGGMSNGASLPSSALRLGRTATDHLRG